MKRVRVLPVAEADIQAAFVWYETQRENLGVRFLDRVEEALGVISRNPEGPAIAVKPDVRRVNLKKFPYGVFYQAQREILVLGVLHGKRSPSLAKKRARGLDL